MRENSMKIANENDEKRLDGRFIVETVQCIGLLFIGVDSHLRFERHRELCGTRTSRSLGTHVTFGHSIDGSDGQNVELRFDLDDLRVDAECRSSPYLDGAASRTDIHTECIHTLQRTDCP